MTRVDGLSTADRPPLRIARAENGPAPAVPSTTREDYLARRLSDRLNSAIRDIRTSLSSSGQYPGPSPAPGPAGTGERLDILA